MSLLTECFSMYSDMSKRTSALSLPKRKAASERATSVFPTPVGPRNMKEPTGRFGFLSPARVRRMARATALIADCWETIRLWSSSSMRRSFSDSSSLIAVMGIPVQRETTSSMSLFVTSWLPVPVRSHRSWRMKGTASRWATSSSRKNAAALEHVAPVHHDADLPAELRHFLGHRGFAELHPAPRLVEEVDGLVGQEAVGDVAARLVHRGLEGLVPVAHVVELLVAVLDAAEDLDRLLLGGRGDLDRLEAALERAVLLDVLPILRGGGGADALDLAAGERGLQDVRRRRGCLPRSPRPRGCGARR